MNRAAVALALLLALPAPVHAGEVLDSRAVYPEGPVLRGDGFLYAEMGADRVSRLDKAGRKSTFFSEKGCGPTAVAPFGDGGLLVLCHLGGALVALDGAGAVRTRYGGAGAVGAVIGQPNDATADGRGGVYFSNPGPFSKQTAPSGQIGHIDAAGRVRSLARGLWYPNGVYYDAAQNALYASEHLARRIWRFGLAPDGSFASGGVIAEIDTIAPKSQAAPYAEAGPDGLERAPNGDLVVALYGEGRLLQLTPEGAFRREIAVPFPYVTNIAFTPAGAAIVVGAYDNGPPSYVGAVIRLPAETFALR